MDYCLFAWRYPSLRVAYVEETEVFDANKPRKVYSSILVKGVNGKDPGAEVLRVWYTIIIAYWKELTTSK